MKSTWLVLPFGIVVVVAIAAMAAMAILMPVAAVPADGPDDPAAPAPGAAAFGAAERFYAEGSYERARLYGLILAENPQQRAVGS
ncbi:MAG: hypothetical protein ACE5IK_09405 [Acidobacteriota bacterium]